MFKVLFRNQFKNLFVEKTSDNNTIIVIGSGSDDDCDNGDMFEK